MRRNLLLTFALAASSVAFAQTNLALTGTATATSGNDNAGWAIDNNEETRWEAPAADFAECGVSRAAIHQRVQRLIDNGVILGSGFDINPKSLGYSTCTYVGLNLERGSMYKDVVKRLVNIPEIVECHFTTGPYTMLIKAYARDNEELMDLLNNKLQTIPGVVSTETLISLEQSIKREMPVNHD